MDCGHDNCLTCPYRRCVCDEASMLKKGSNRKRKGSDKRREYDRQYYQTHKEEKKAKARKRYAEQKRLRLEESKNAII